MLELTKSLGLDAIKLVFAGLVVTALVQTQKSPGALLVPGVVAVAVLIVFVYFVQHFINKKK